MFVLIDLYICVLPYENTVVEDERLEGNTFNHEVESWIQDTMLLDAKGGHNCKYSNAQNISHPFSYALNARCIDVSMSIKCPLTLSK